MKKLVCLILLWGFLLSACGENASRSDESATIAPVPTEYAGKSNPLGSDAAAEGAQVFRSNCEVCHGPQGHGDGPAGQSLDPRPKNLADLQKLVGDDFLFWRISRGKPGTSMVAWEGILTEEQIWQTVAFIRTLE